MDSIREIERLMGAGAVWQGSAVDSGSQLSGASVDT